MKVSPAVVRLVLNALAAAITAGVAASYTSNGATAIIVAAVLGGLHVLTPLNPFVGLFKGVFVKPTAPLPPVPPTAPVK